MILFKEDWNKPAYRSAIIDYDTKNKSFLNVVGIYEQMGVENRFFPLTLVNPNLKGIDPHDPYLTEELQIMIAVECKINPWYFFREVLKAPASGSGSPIPIRANRGNIALWWLFFNHITTMLIQPRQTGKSFSTDSLNCYNLQIACQNTIIHLYTKDDKLRTINVARLKALMDELPPYLDFRTKKDINNTESIGIGRLGNTYSTAVAQASIKAARNIGRGHQIPIHHLDEMPFCDNASETVPALLASGTAARESAQAANSPYGIIITTTCGYLNTASGQYAKEIYDESLPWNEKLLDCKNLEELTTTIRKNNTTRLETNTEQRTRKAPIQVLLQFNHRQLGYTDEWLEEQLEMTKSEGDSAKADYLNQWVRGSDASPISRENLEIINNSLEPEPYIDISLSHYITNWYISKEEFNSRCPNRYLVLSVDPSEAVGRDDIGLVLRDVKTGEVLACGKYNETNTITFAKWLVWWLTEFPNLTMIIEKKNMGTAYLDLILQECVIRKIDAFKRIFNWVVDESEEIPDFKQALKTPIHHRDHYFYLKYRAYFGYSTTGSGKASRDNIYGRAFNSSIKHTASTVRDRSLINQLNCLIFKNNRIDHRPGEHDDLVFSWCLGFWFLILAKNKHHYNIPSSIVLSDVRKKEIESMGGEDAVRKQQEQAMLRNELLKLKQYIKTLINQEEINRYKSLYKSKLERLEHKDQEILNIDDIKIDHLEIKENTKPKESLLDRLRNVYGR